MSYINSDGQTIGIQYYAYIVSCEVCGLVEPNHMTNTCPYFWTYGEEGESYDTPDHWACPACGFMVDDCHPDPGHENLCCGQAGFTKEQDCGMSDCIIHAEDLHYGPRNTH